jgi:hypothetical protein
MGDVNIPYEVAKAIQGEYATMDPQPAWRDLSPGAIQSWIWVAEAAIKAYRNCTERG